MNDPLIDDADVLHTMNKYGGGFVSALARAGFAADENNLAKLKAAWPELWAEYSAWTRARLRRSETAERGPG